MYQITVKAYDGSIPVQTGSWSPEAGESVRDMEQIPVRVTCTWDRASRTDRFRIRAEALEDLTFPVSVSLERVEEKWTRNEYVFMPAAVYNGNRMESRKIPYPPYCGEKTETGWREVITDIPHLSKDGENRDIQFLSGDMSTPAFGYYSQENRTGVLLLAKHEENGRYTGFTMREKGEKAVFGISAPGVREGNVYFFGELPDGSGFFPTCNCASDDAGVMLKKSDALELEAECHTFRADSLNHYFKQFDSLQENLEQGKTFYSIPFSKAYETIKDKYMRLNFSDEGYYRVGTTDVVPGYWQANAFVRFFEKHGQIGQFIDMESEEILAGDTASAAIVSAGLSLAYEYFGEKSYLDTAEQLADLYWTDYLRRGITNGGPGEICQAPDSESAFGLLESFVQLYETTGRKKWLQAAEEAFELAVTWVVSYDFHFPDGSAAAKIQAHTRGTVFANAQNKHSAPGICTLSGSSMLKLYRFTGKERYLERMSRISHAVSQFVSLEDRPIDTLAGRPLPVGYINERVQMSDWEGKRTVGGFICDSSWPETTMLLTYTEIPGIYVDLDRDVMKCSDHVKAELIGGNEKGTMLKITNPTAYDAEVTVLADHSLQGEKLGAFWLDKMKRIRIRAGEEITTEVKKTE